jgi:hypothetical protein
MVSKHTTFIAVIAAVIVTVTMLPVAAESSEVAPKPSISFTSGATLVQETFDSVDAWEQYSSPMGVEIGVEDGAYRMFTMNGGFVWGLNTQQHSDVIIDVKATQLSIFPDNGFGVMCRADESNNGDGYYFIVNGSGYFSIRVGEGDMILPIVDWAQSEAVHAGIDTNSIRAVCMGDYLAMYANGTLLAEAHDSTFSAGYAGLAVAAVDNGADVSFDDLLIAEAIPQ